jgi:hypothetical protein
MATGLRPGPLRCRGCRGGTNEAKLWSGQDRRGWPRLRLECATCRTALTSIPVPRRSRFGLLGFLLALEDVGVAFGLSAAGEVVFDGLLPHRRLLAELYHHYAGVRRRLTRASCPWPPQPGEGR